MLFAGNHKKYTYQAIVVAFLATTIFLSCSSSHTVEELSEYNERIDSLSVEIAKDVTIVYTDSAILRAKISAPVMKRYPDKDEPKLEMPEGVSADFFGDLGEIQSTLTANYAMHYEKEDRIEIRDSVRVINKNDEEIKTDELIWDKKKRKVTSDKPVRVRIRNEKIIMADGFESDETFLHYKFTKVTGVVYLNEEIATPN